MRFLLLLVFSTTVLAHGPEVSFDPHPGAQVPLATENTPIVLVLGYQGCINLCGTTLDGVALALRGTGLVADRDYRAIFMSIDPRDERAPAPPRAGWHFVTGATHAAEVAKAVGFRYFYEPGSGEFAHPAGFVVLTPQGKVSRYFPGVRYDTGELRSAIANAREGQTQSAFDRLLLVCFHDPVSGRNTQAVLLAMRIAMAAFLVALGLLAWRRLR